LQTVCWRRAKSTVRAGPPHSKTLCVKSRQGSKLEDDKNLQKLKYATEWQVEIGKVLQSFDPVLRPLDDMAKHGITMATVLLGISTSIVGGFASGSFSISGNYLVILAAWIAFVAAAVAGSIQLYKLSKFRETIHGFCFVLLGKESSVAERQKAMEVMKSPKKSALVVEYLALCIGIMLLVIWAVVRAVAK
jgi:hypothetical protein